MLRSTGEWRSSRQAEGAVMLFHLFRTAWSRGRASLWDTLL